MMAGHYEARNVPERVPFRVVVNYFDVGVTTICQSPFFATGPTNTG